MLQEADVADTPTLFCAWQPLLMLRIWRTRAAAAGRRGGRKGVRRGRQGRVPADHAAVRGVHRAVAAAQLLDDALAHAARRAGAPLSFMRGSTYPPLATAMRSPWPPKFTSPRHPHVQSLEALVSPSSRHTHAQSLQCWCSPSLAAPMRRSKMCWWWGALQQLVVGGEAAALPLVAALTLAAAACAAGVSVLEARRLQGDGAQGGRAPGAGAPAPDRAMRPCFPSCAAQPAPPLPSPCAPALRAVTALEPCLHACGFLQSAACSPGGRGEEPQKRTRSRSSMLVFGAELALLCA